MEWCMCHQAISACKMAFPATSCWPLPWSSNTTMRIRIALLLGFVCIALTPSLPQTLEGHPDFNGVWSGRGHADMSVETPGGLPFTAEGKAAFADVKNQYDPTGFCLYPGVTR